MRAANSPVSITLKYFTHEAAVRAQAGPRTYIKEAGSAPARLEGPAEKLKAAGVNLASPKSHIFFSPRAKKGKV